MGNRALTDNAHGHGFGFFVFFWVGTAEIQSKKYYFVYDVTAEGDEVGRVLQGSALAIPSDDGSDVYDDLYGEVRAATPC